VVPQVPPGPQDLLDLQDQRASPGHQEKVVCLARQGLRGRSAPQENPDLLAQVERVDREDHLDPPDHADQTERMDRQDPLDLLGLVDCGDQQARVEREDHLVR